MQTLGFVERERERERERKRERERERERESERERERERDRYTLLLRFSSALSSRSVIALAEISRFFGS